MKTLSEQAKEKKGNEVTAGDQLRESQKNELHQAFTHVNKEWIKQTKTFEELLKEAKEFQSLCKDVGGLELNQLSAKDGKILAQSKNASFTMKPTKHSMTQLCSRLGLPSSYMQSLIEEDQGLFDINYNRTKDRLVLNKNPDVNKEVFLRLKTEGETYKLRAVLSSRYAVINNLPVIETLNDIIPGGRVSHQFYNGDTFRANILIPESIRTESDSDYGGGISVLNNETGQLTFRSRPFVFRHVCWNGNIWDKAEGIELTRKHIGNINWKEFRRNLVLNLNEQIPLVQERIDKVLSLKGLPVTEQDIEKAIIYVGQKEKLTQEVMRDWNVGVQQERTQSGKELINTAFGIVQGLTRSAQRQDIEVQDLMETLSGRLVESKWDRLLSSAKVAITDEQVETMFRF